MSRFAWPGREPVKELPQRRMVGSPFAIGEVGISPVQPMKNGRLGRDEITPVRLSPNCLLSIGQWPVALPCDRRVP